MKIKTKFNIGDTVWFMEQNRPMHNKVTYVYITLHAKDGSDIQSVVSYLVGFSGITRVPEATLFESKSELLKSL